MLMETWMQIRANVSRWIGLDGIARRSQIAFGEGDRQTETIRP